MKSYFTFARFLEITSLVILLSGCSATKVIEQVPVYVHDTTQTVRELHDSIYVDRWHTEYQKGDTIFITNEVTKTVTKIQVDTSYQYVEKPVVVSKTEIVEVEKKLGWWQKLFIWLGVITLLAGIAYLLYKLRKIWLPWVKR
ncbi:MAG: hypothetical protein J6X59_00370 [Bacteroidales bacterium]|nr:hypothetical protein [Bacteroidales bacterium]